MAKINVIKFYRILLFSSLIMFSQASHAGFFKSLGRSIAKIVNSATSSFNSVLNLVTNCDDSKIEGIKTKCFNSSENNKIAQGLALHKSSRYLLAYRGGLLDSHSHVKSNTQTIVNLDSRQMRNTYLIPLAIGCNSSVWGCHVAGTTFLTATGLALDKGKISGLLLHESDHNNLKLHNCGTAADRDLSGPYGLEAIYHMSLATDEGSVLTQGERAISMARAAGIANYQLCGVSDLRNTVLNYRNLASSLKPIPLALPSAGASGGTKNSRQFYNELK